MQFLKGFFKTLLALVLAGAIIGPPVMYMQTMPPSRADAISSDYFKLRDNFRRAATTAGAKLQSIPISSKGPKGEELTIDVAWFGSEIPENVLLHISGTHGVEGYAGSAIQSSILSKGVTAPPNSAVIFVHALNPWGMANFRRFNEANVDLNRNFITDERAFSGAPEAYKLVESFLNPVGMPSKIDFFYIDVVLNVLKHGFDALKQAIAGGQYEYPKGIYFGGSKMEEGLVLFKDSVVSRLSQAKKVYVIEIHTGLGTWAKDVLFWSYGPNNPKTKWLSSVTKETFSSDAPDEGVGFKTPGDLQNEVPKLLPGADVYWVLQEFGAYGPVRTLRALRDENRYQHSGGTDLNHWSKQMLLEAFSPGAKDWQDEVLRRGNEFYGRMLLALESNPNIAR